MIGKGNDCLSPIFMPVDSDKKKFLRVRCGRCFACRKAHAREWSFRLACEAKEWKNSCFVTLTYDDVHVPKSYVHKEVFLSSDNQKISCDVKTSFGSFDDNELIEFKTLCKRDVQLFIKRLRKNLGFKIKYFCAGEYGTKTHRPHYHLIIFGLSEEFKHIINDSWKKGFITVGDVRDASIQYVAGYCEKKIFLDDNNPFLVRESLNCSQHLGEHYFMTHYADKVDDKHLTVRWGEFDYSIPRVFRKKLVEAGVLSQQSQEIVSEIQRQQYYALCQDLKNKNTTPEQFFKQRFKNVASSHFSRVNARDKI